MGFFFFIYAIDTRPIMKNFVLFIMMFVAICVTGSRIIGEINQKHEEEVDNLVKTYESQIEELKNENSEINEELTELYDNIYNRENGKPYYIRIEHDGYIHTYEGDNKFLGRGSHSVMKFY